MEQYFRTISIKHDAIKEEFQKEFKKQLYLQYTDKEAQAKLHWLTQQGTVREYVQEFSELMLQISNLSEKKSFHWFKYGVEALGEARVTLIRKDKFESSKPKEMDNDGRDHDEDGNGNSGNGKPPNGKPKPNNKPESYIHIFDDSQPHCVVLINRGMRVGTNVTPSFEVVATDLRSRSLDMEF
ncbi:hypothetical protein PVK06_034439 [Gossypium arboreum]|uniref:Retrotransposon gag domain-containing protein n=1 Tax=Gossypium arboreum TaxID=29729 RepID=A0ABR0NE86_GOSAR|nr:hypothetical protein PVK06_034439 [Gossypium arboreum]